MIAMGFTLKTGKRQMQWVVLYAAFLKISYFHGIPYPQLLRSQQVKVLCVLVVVCVYIVWNYGQVVTPVMVITVINNRALLYTRGKVEAGGYIHAQGIFQEYETKLQFITINLAMVW